MRQLRVSLLGLIMILLSFRLLAAGPPEILLANIYREGIVVTEYLVSEKLDGVRGIWDGEKLRFRSGGEIHAPAWFVESLPKVPLDGELWLGRGSFERLVSVVRKDVPVDDEWRQIRYMIFELPRASGTFRERVTQMQELVSSTGLPWLQAVEQFSVADHRELQNKLSEVVNAGGEGLMLHRADAFYETGRSDSLLKLKPWLDAEAVVIGYLPGKGRNAGRMGALRLRTPSGIEFSVGTGFTDWQRQHPPVMGSLVTYRYRELTANGIPRFATFLRERVPGW